MKTTISHSAATPSDGNTSAQGNRKTLSTSKITNRNASTSRPASVPYAWKYWVIDSLDSTVGRLGAAHPPHHPAPPATRLLHSGAAASAPAAQARCPAWLGAFYATGRNPSQL